MFVDVRIDNLRLLEFFPVSNIILNFEPLVSSGFSAFPASTIWPIFRSGFELFTECFQMRSYGGIVIDIRSSSRKNQPEVRVGRLPTFYITTAEKRFDDFFGFRIGGDEFGSLLSVDDEGLVESG